MNFNPTRTKYINQSPKLPRATGLVIFTDACSDRVKLLTIHIDGSLEIDIEI